MKILKRSLCIFLSVVVLFFSVNNSYFSPHKMDTVEASSIVVGGTVITVDLILKLVAALAVAGLAVGVIVEWSDMDIEQLAMDLHAWCKENYDAISEYLEAQPALKEWVLSDYWVIVVDSATGSSPEPSPSPEDENENLPSTGQEETGLTQEQFEALLNDHHGFTNAFKWVARGTATGITLTSILAPISYVAEYGHYVDSEGNVLESDDPRIKEVTVDSAINAVAQAYMQSKIDTFGTVNAGTDAITQALQSRYISNDLYTDYRYYGAYLVDSLGIYTVRYAYHYKNWASDKYEYYDYTYNSKPVAVLSETSLSIYTLKDEALYQERKNNYYEACYINIPIFTDTESALNFLNNGDDSACINRERKQNYIDTSDDYGWASTADFTPDDLAQAMPGVMGNLDGRSVSMSGIVTAINALKNQLEENNPNVGGSDDPAGVVLTPYPTVDDYVSTVEGVINDPTVFPKADDVADPNPDPGTDDVVDSAPDTDTMKDYSGLLGLIIGILQNILQAIKDLLGWFIIDFPAIKAHILTALDDVPALTGYEDFLALVDSAKAQITDSYDYPVITVECPEILLPYWKQEQIILLDFEDYATYFIWVRTAMAFAILFGFALWLIKDIKVSFTLN